MQFFESNISSLQKQNIGFAQKIEAVGDAQQFELFMDEGNYASLNFIDKTDFMPLYESKPEEEIVLSLSELEPFENYPYLYMYGLGNGTLVQKLLENKKLKRIVIIEPEIEIAYIVFHLVDFAQAIQEGRLVLFGAEDVSLAVFHPLFPTLQEQRYARVYDMHVNTPYYQKKHSEHLLRTNQVMLETIYHAINIAGNDTKDALIGLKQHIINIPVMLQTPPLHHFFKQLLFKESAILVSTGPSLTKQLPLLKKIAPYVRIVAVDASFPVLYKEGIKPDVVVSMERVPQSARFFKELPKEAFDGVVIALSSLQHKDVVESIKGGQMQMSMRPLGYMTYLGPDQWGYMGIGQSAANMGYELIFQSRFKNCILIGQDLAYAEDGSSHAKGHVFGVDNVKQKETDVWAVGWGGKNAVRTNHTWTMFRNFFEKDVFDTQGILETINATEGGARIAGTKELSFADAVKKYITNKKPKPKVSFLKVIEDEKTRLSAEVESRLDAMALYVSSLLEELKVLFLETAALSEAIEKQIGHTRGELENVLTKIESLSRYHSDELYDLVVWHIAQSMMLVQELRIAPLQVYKPKNDAESLERLELLVHAYKPWLFSYCGVLDATLKTIEYARARRLIKKVEKIEVCLGENIIDTISIEKMQAEHGRVFDVDMRGILYDAPDDYQTQLNSVAFRDAKSGKELPRAFVDVIERDDMQYSELLFGKKLQEPIDTQQMEKLTSREAIGFMASEKNIDDSSFVKLVALLKAQNYGVPFVAFCFNEMQRQKALEIFGEDTEIVFPKTLEDVVSSVSVYLYSRVSKNNSFPTDAQIRHLLLKRVSKVFVVDLQTKIEEASFIEHIALQNSEAKVCFFGSLVSRILKGHSKFSEYSFQNSLNLAIGYEADSFWPQEQAVGFLLTQEVLADSFFIGFVQKAIRKFPLSQVKIFYFHKSDVEQFLEMCVEKFNNVEFVHVDTIVSILQSVDVWLDVNIEKFSEVKKLLTSCNEQSYIVNVSKRYEISLSEYDKKNKSHAVFENPSFFGFNENDLREANGSLSLLTTLHYIDPKKVDFSAPAYEFLLLQIEAALKSKGFRAHIRAWLQLNEKYILNKAM